MCYTEVSVGSVSIQRGPREVQPRTRSQRTHSPCLQLTVLHGLAAEQFKDKGPRSGRGSGLIEVSFQVLL